jgi:uncharacterized membrane protein
VVDGRGAALAAAVTAAAMVATPLARRGGATRRVLSSAVVGGLATTTGLGTARRWGGRRTLGALAVIAPSTALIEQLGTATGVPFGAYEYTPALRPKLGGVPVIVPAAWFAMAVPAREVAHGALGGRSTRVRRIVLGSLALTAWDLFLDPQMVGEGYWRWARPGRYRGIPATNFLGWFVTGLGVMAVLELVLPPDQPADVALAGQYAAMGVMETVAFAVFFGDRRVALAGGAGMLSVAVAAARATRRFRRG